ncbi:hypothetical protein Tco_0377458 [Tanacetum coccineum]
MCFVAPASSHQSTTLVVKNDSITPGNSFGDSTWLETPVTLGYRGDLLVPSFETAGLGPETDHLSPRLLVFQIGDPSFVLDRNFLEIHLRKFVIASRIDQGVGSTSGIRACALRNFDLGKMELENSQNNALAKLHMLKLGEYEMSINSIKVDLCPLTTARKVCKRMMTKPEILLLMALPNEHQLTFNQYVDAQYMFIVITARFGGNDATKKTQKALLKQTFLRSLPSEWDTHVVVWMNKPNFETMGLDDLYKNFKIVEQKVKRTVAANNDDKNLAFLTTSSPSSVLILLRFLCLFVCPTTTRAVSIVHEDLEQLALMGYHTDSDKLTFQKGAFSPQWRFLIHNILHCLSPKKTAWEQFSSNIATATICLATNRKLNFSRMIFEHMVFSNMKRPTKGFSVHEVALFPTMLDDPEPSTSPSRITTSPSSSPSPSPTQPSPTQPSPTQPSPTQPSPTQPSST